MKRREMFTGALMAAALVGVLPGAATAQIRRSSGGGPPPPPPAGTPMRARVPYAGTWDGTFTMSDGPGARAPVQIVMAFDADSAGNYSGYTVLPNNAHAPHLKTTVKGSEMTWEQTNSGGGRWVYTAKLAARDSIVGTYVLLDWPQGNGARPTGKFALVRRAAAAP